MSNPGRRVPDYILIPVNFKEGDKPISSGSRPFFKLQQMYWYFLKIYYFNFYLQPLLVLSFFFFPLLFFSTIVLIPISFLTDRVPGSEDDPLPELQSDLSRPCSSSSTSPVPPLLTPAPTPEGHSWSWNTLNAVKPSTLLRCRLCEELETTRRPSEYLVQIYI